MLTPQHLFDDIPSHLPAELFQPLLEVEGLRIERIISQGHSSPPGYWYDQAQEEWVLLVRGSAKLELGDGTITELNVGDYLLIPAGMKHRVAWTLPNEPTVWLAVHFTNN